MEPPFAKREIHQRGDGAVVVGKCLGSDIESPHGGIPECCPKSQSAIRTGVMRLTSMASDAAEGGGGGGEGDEEGKGTHGWTSQGMMPSHWQWWSILL